MEDNSFEKVSIVSDALTELTEDFKYDFEVLLRWCVQRPQYTEYKRLMVGMPPEPYGVEELDGLPGLEKLLFHAETVLGNAWCSWRWLYSILEDKKSKLLLLNVIAYRVIGWRYISLPLDTERFWSTLSMLSKGESIDDQENIIDTGFHNLKLHKFDLLKYNYPVKLYSEAFGVFNEFIYSQYSFRGSKLSALKHDDCIIDCGACFGGTSLYFSSLIGQAGRVLSFEFMPENLKIFNLNLSLNSNLKNRIELISAPVWSTTGLTMVIEGSGPAAQVHPLGGMVRSFIYKSKNWLNSKITRKKSLSHYVTSTTIDKEVKKREVKNVGLIKMDIEGSEYSALVGAKHTIEQYKPILAICVYHRLIDFYEVPQFINSLGLGYKFYLQHSTVHGDETVIFAIPPQ